MKDLLCVDGLDDVDSVYARRQSVMIGFNVELAESAHHPSEKTKRSTDSREAPALLDKKVAFWKEKTKRNTGIGEAPATMDKKTAASCDAAVLKFLL